MSGGGGRGRRRRARRAGWPEGLAFDAVRATLADRAAEYDSIVARVDEVRPRLGRVHPFRRTHLVAIAGFVATVSSYGVARTILGPHDRLASTVVGLVVLGALTATTQAWWTREQRLPRRRIFLRAVGVPVCVHCGQAIAAGDPQATCPECGRAHDDVPLDFGFDVEPGLARDREDAPYRGASP